MQRNLSICKGRAKYLSLSMLIASAFLLAGCGPLGDDDGDPTATSESIAQPTTTEEAPTDGPSTPSSFVDTAGDATPTSESDSPIAFTPGNGGGTPSTPEETFVVVVGTPVAPAEGETPDSAAAATPDSDDQGTSFTGSDGTDGATPPADGLEAGTDDVPLSEATPAEPGEATPAGDVPFFTEEIATPSPSSPDATPQVGELADLEPVTVTSCDPDNVPAFAGEVTDFLTVTDVNFRAGPGTDCDLVVDIPIGANNSVTVLSGPVVREGEEDFTWVQVQIVDDIGWIVLDSIEPAP
jgi:hypothetical protein